MYHYRSTRKRYNSTPKTASCPFCDPAEHKERIIRETEHAYVIPNRTFYDQWEARRVVDHLMIVPKQHVLQLQDLSQVARLDVINLMAEYEAADYQIYARSPGSKSRSVDHQHTHLIKTKGKHGRGLFILFKPYIVWRLP